MHENDKYPNGYIMKMSVELIRLLITMMIMMRKVTVSYKRTLYFSNHTSQHLVFVPTFLMNPKKENCIGEEKFFRTYSKYRRRKS